MPSWSSQRPKPAPLFWTGGYGAYLRRDGIDEPLAPPTSSALVDVNLDGPTLTPSGFEPFGYWRRRRSTTRFGRESPRRRSLLPGLPRAAYLIDGHLRDSVHFSSGIAICQAAGCIVTGLRGQPVHTGVGGLVVAADERAHAALIAIIERPFTTTV